MRVFNFLGQVVAYIQEIIDNGYAYESNGSVYFDVQVKLCTVRCGTAVFQIQ